MKKTTLLGAVLLPFVVAAQSLQQKADALMQAYSTQQKFSGNVLVAVKNKIVFSKSYGKASLEENRSNSSQTQFRAGSLTKMFTAVLVMQLAEEKKLSLADPVSKYVNNADPSGKVTVQHLLSHTSGLNGSTKPGAATLEQMIASYVPAAASFAAGERFEYNNFNYILLSFIAQKCTGIPFAALLQNSVLQKTGMLHSGIDYSNRIAAGKASGYVTDPATGEWVLTGTDSTVAAASGAGALYTTTEDLFRWSQHIGSTKLLSKQSWNRLFTAVKPGYGFGWMLGNQRGHAKTGHTGSIPGFIADFAWFPEDRILITFLSNYQDTDGRKLEENLTAVAYNEPYDLPVQKKAVKLSLELLQEYTGVYALNANTQITVQLEGTALMAIAPGGDKVELVAESKDHFFLKGPEMTVEFRRAGEKIESMFIDMQGGQLFKRK